MIFIVVLFTYLPIPYLPVSDSINYEFSGEGGGSKSCTSSQTHVYYHYRRLSTDADGSARRVMSRSLPVALYTKLDAEYDQ